MKFSIKNFINKCDQIHRKPRIWSHLLKKFLIENFIFCAVSKADCQPKRYYRNESNVRTEYEQNSVFWQQEPKKVPEILPNHTT